MTDIAERLRRLAKSEAGMPYRYADLMEAADEIERLRKLYDATVRDYEAARAHFSDVQWIALEKAAKLASLMEDKDNFEIAAAIRALREKASD